MKKSIFLHKFGRARRSFEGTNTLIKMGSIKCPCCGKSFKRLASHLNNSVKCALFMEKNVMNMESQLLDSNTFKQACVEEFQGLKSLQSTINTEEVPLDNNHTFIDHDYDDDDVYASGINYQNYIAEQNTEGLKDKNFLIQLQLLHLLHEIGTPLYAYDKIMDWATAAFHGGYSFPSDFSSRKHVIKKLSQIFCMDKMQPTCTEVRLETGDKSMVNHFDFEQMCCSILSDTTLMKECNYAFGNNNPTSFRKPSSNILSCIEDGDMFQRSIRHYCHDEHDFCLGIKMFIDGTHTDVHSNWVLEPVTFTFTFFNNVITRQRSAWRVLGFVNDLNKKSTAWNNEITSHKKIIDYHKQLSVIFKSFVECQNRGGFFWDLMYQNKKHKLKMKPILILVVGDAVGNHKLCGMYNNFHNAYRVNHSCDCPLMRTDDPNYICKFVLQKDIDLLNDVNDIETLNQMSYHNIKNAFRKIMKGNHDAGLNAMLPSEILHQLFLGVIEKVLDAFIDNIAPKGRTRMDKFGCMIYSYGRRESDRTIPVFRTKNGFTNLTRLKGSDRLGILLVLLIMMVSKYKSFMIRGIQYYPSDRKLNNYTIIFHKLLCLSQWLSKDQINLDELPEFHNKVKLLMMLIKSTVKRSSMKGWKVSKFHELLHISRDVKLFGPAEGYDGRPGESAHKDTKRLSKKTQMRKHVFENQTSTRIYESMVIKKGIDISKTIYSDMFQSFDNSSETSANRITSPFTNYYIYQGADDQIMISNGIISSKHAVVFRKIYDRFSNLFDDGKIPCRTSVSNNNGIIFRASEHFYDNTPWNDWAWIKWEYGPDIVKEVPAIIFAFLDLRDVDLVQLRLSGLEPSIYAYVCSLKEMPERSISTNITIVKRVTLETLPNNELCFRYVNINTITRACYIVPNLTSEDEIIELPKNWIFVESRTSWADHL